MRSVFDFCEYVGMPKAYTDVYTEADRALCEAGAEGELAGAVERIFTDKAVRTPDIVKPLEVYCKRTGLSPYTLHGVFVIRGFLAQREDYIATYGEEVFHDTARDLVYKTAECEAAEDVIGTVSISWYNNLLRRDIFALGRLQYHIVPFRFESYEKNGLSLKQGDPILNIHIPSAGKLTEELCFDSYRRAFRFYRDRFAGDVMPFSCRSWMLYEKNLEYFPVGGNLARFMSDFDLVEHLEDEGNQNVWRIYGKRYTDYTELPRDNTLRAALADYLLAGKKMGWGHGIFAHNGKEIVR